MSDIEKAKSKSLLDASDKIEKVLREQFETAIEKAKSRSLLDASDFWIDMRIFVVDGELTKFDCEMRSDGNQLTTKDFDGHSSDPVKWTLLRKPEEV